MAAEITAWFSNIDEAEAAARALRRSGRGIRSLRIRQPRLCCGEAFNRFPAALALYATPVGQSYLSGGSLNVSPGFFPGLFAEQTPEGGSDGPGGREECLMVIKSEEGSAQKNASLLTALHAQSVHTVPGLPC